MSEHSKTPWGYVTIPTPGPEECVGAIKSADGGVIADIIHIPVPGYADSDWLVFTKRGDLLYMFEAVNAYENLTTLQAIVDKLPDLILDALGSYHTRHVRDHDGDGLLLCDALSDPAATNIHYGLDEVKLLADHVIGAITDYADALAAKEGE